jgi:signal peptidase I
VDLRTAPRLVFTASIHIGRPRSTHGSRGAASEHMKSVAAPKTRTEVRPAPRERPPPVQEKNETMEWVKSIAIAILLFLVIRTFVVTAYSIPSESMESTLLVGDYLMANNAIFGATLPFTGVRLPAVRDPRRSEIVVFRPEYNQPVIDVVKRVVAVPGDTIEMRDRVVYINGARADEPYLHPPVAPDQPLNRLGMEGYQWHLAHLANGTDPNTYAPTRNTWGPLVVPPESYFMMGDNRDQSLDSRYVGFIPRDVIRGKPLFVYFSYDRLADRPSPRPLTAARWGRIGSGIH